MKFCLMNVKKIKSKDKEYCVAVIYDYNNDVACRCFISEKTFSLCNEKQLISKSVDDFVSFRYDIKKQAYVLVFDIK